MHRLSNIGVWDILLVLAVILQATAMAYVYQPKWKAFLLTVPIPFTFATMAVGRNIDVTNVAGLLLLLIFTHAVRILHYEIKVPIVAAIAGASVMYCLIGSILAPLLPRTSAAFWTALSIILILAFFLWCVTAHRIEPGHRSPLPIWLKLPIITVVILGLISIKARMQGFVTVFPMVGVVAAYEARHSLWTISRQIPVIMLAFVPMLAVCYLLQGRVGLGVGVSLGWIAYLALLVPLTCSMWTNDKKQIPDSAVLEKDE